MAKQLIPATGLLVALLAGCASPADKAAKLKSNHALYCEFLGYTTDSDAWRECIEQEQSRVPGAVNPVKPRPPY